MTAQTYVSNGMNGAGPINKNPKQIITLPLIVTNFGLIYLSMSQPKIGAVTAYTPPLMTKTTPKTIGVRLKSRKCGSNVAEINPIEALVAEIASAQIKTPGIFNTVKIEKRLSLSSSHGSCRGRIQSVMMATENNVDPSTTNGRKKPPKV